MSTTAVAQVLDKAAPALRPGSEPALRQISAPAIVPQPAKGGRRKTLRQLALATGLIAAVAGGGWYGDDWWTTGRFIQSTDDAYVGGNVTPLAPHVDGFVEHVLVTDNERVHAGQVLIQLDPRDYQAALENAQAVLKARTAAAESLRAQYTLQQSTIRQQEADIVAKKAQATFASQEATRCPCPGAAELWLAADAQDRNTALDQEAQAAVTVAQAAARSRKPATQGAQRADRAKPTRRWRRRRPICTRPSSISSYTEIRSPIDGYVGNRAGQVGAYVTRGHLSDLGHPRRRALGRRELQGRPARPHGSGADPSTVTADVLPGHVFHGHVASLRPAPAPCSASSRPRTRPATSPRSCSAFRFGSLLDSGDRRAGASAPGPLHHRQRRYPGSGGVP